jgi:hypothetical protein
MFMTDREWRSVNLLSDFKNMIDMTSFTYINQRLQPFLNFTAVLPIPPPHSLKYLPLLVAF